jgi:hypothetical protein
MELKNYDNGKNPFGTPEGYFDNLERDILRNSCGTHGLRRGNIRSIAWIKWASYAATVAIIATVSFSLLGKSGAVNDQATGNGAAHTASLQETPGNDTYELDAEYIDNLLSCYPIDDYTFYSYLTENE